jgi:hypothetical protein
MLGFFGLNSVKPAGDKPAGDKPADQVDGQIDSQVAKEVELKKMQSDITALQEELKKINEQLARILQLLSLNTPVEQQSMAAIERPPVTSGEFGYDLDAAYERLKTSGDTETLERLYYCQFLQYYNAIRAQTLGAIQNFYLVDFDSNTSVQDMWIAKNYMVPSSYFAGRASKFPVLAKVCQDVDFIEANMSVWNIEQLKQNPHLNIAFYKKHKIDLGQHLYKHDISQEDCEALFRMAPDLVGWLDLARNPKAPVAFMTTHADLIDWAVASQYNSYELLQQNLSRVVPEKAALNLNLPNVFNFPDLTDVHLQKIMFEALDDPNYVILLNANWRYKLYTRPGPSEWKKHIYTNATPLVEYSVPVQLADLIDPADLIDQADLIDPADLVVDLNTSTYIDFRGGVNVGLHAEQFDAAIEKYDSNRHDEHHDEHRYSAFDRYGNHEF